MEPAVGVLVIEDSPSDFALVRRQVLRGWPEARLSRADSPEAVRQALDDATGGGAPIDVVLSDYNLPGMDFARTLGEIRARLPDVPVIVVSGAVGEERAVELIRLGATDFVRKDNLERLVPAIRRALDEVAERRARLAAEQALLTLSRAVEQSPVSVVITDPDGNIEYVNPKFVEVCGYDAEEVRGKNPRILKSGNNPESLYRDLWRTITGGRAWQGELQNRRKTGELYWERAVISPIRSAEGKLLHFVGVKEDVTRRKEAEEALLSAMQAAEDANRAKTVFLSHMSHELRTPLTAVLGYAEVLAAGLGGPLTPEQGEFIGNILAGGNHLLSLIDEVLDISRIELGSYRVHLTPTDVSALARECAAMFQAQCEDKGIVLAVADAAACTVSSDGRALRQILINLLANAVKYTRQGGAIGVSVDREAPRTRVSVADTGCGIMPDKLGTVFESFQRADPWRADPARGVGLGLAICRRLATLLGGELTIESQPGRGTTVHLTLWDAEQCPI